MGKLRLRGKHDYRDLPSTGEFVNVFTGTHTPIERGSGVWSFYESMSDVVGDSEGDKVHPCYHAKYVASHYTLPRLVNYLGNYVEMSRFYEFSDFDDLPSLFPGPSETDKARLAEEAFNAFFQQMPQEVSLPNFVWELQELKDMIPKIEEGLTKTVAGGYLTYSFGYLPFVSDITKLRHLSKTVADRLAYLRRTWGRETRVSYEGVFDVPDRTASTIGQIDGFGSHSYTLPGYTGYYRAGGYLYHKLNDLYGVEGTLRGFAGALGLNNPVGVLWEATPYSFVADWFTRSKEVVNHLAVQPYEGVWEVRRLTHSFSWGGAWHMNLIYDGGNGVTRVFAMEDGISKLYARGLGLPVSSSVFSQEGLDPRQQLLAGALLASR